MTVSMRVMSAGDGYRYLLKSVAAGDGDRSLSTPLTRYYAEAGNPPGFWLGSGIAAFGGGNLPAGSQVSEQQLQLLVGMGRDPLTGAPLGRAYQQFASVAERVEERTKKLNPNLNRDYRDQLVAQIEAEEKERGTRRAVAGFDYTFSVPKSVSAIWAVADAGTQSLIADAHHAAVAELIALIEQEVAATRVGATSPDGAVAQVDVQGVAATAFDHYDSRSHDPQLHTHVVISNKVKTVQDGKWRTLYPGLSGDDPQQTQRVDLRLRVVTPEPVECGDRPGVGVAQLDAQRPDPDIQAHAMPSGTGAIPVRINDDRACLARFRRPPVARVEHDAGQRSHPFEFGGEQVRDRHVPPVMIPGSDRVADPQPGPAQRVEALGGGNRNHQIAAHEPDRVLHAALLMTRIRVAETGLEPVNPAQNSENKRV